MLTRNPKSTPALVMGILSIVCCWFPIAGIILGILAIVFANQSKRLIAAVPELEPTKGVTNGGFITGIIGLILSVIYLIYWCFIMLFVASMFSRGGNF